MAQKGLEESHDCSISASPSSIPCSLLLPTLRRGLTTARENQQGREKPAGHGKTSKAAVSKPLPVFLASAGHSCRGSALLCTLCQRWQAPKLSFLFQKRGKNLPIRFVSWAAATRRLRSWGGVRHEATSLPRDPSRGSHILLPLLKQPFSTAQGATQLLKSGICPVSFPGSQAAVLESTESSCL